MIKIYLDFYLVRGHMATDVDHGGTRDLEDPESLQRSMGTKRIFTCHEKAGLFCERNSYKSVVKRDFNTERGRNRGREGRRKEREKLHDDV